MLYPAQYRGHHDELAISAHVRQGNREEVWRTKSKQTMHWNPEQNFEDDKNRVHLQCRKNVKLIDDVLKERLQSVSLLITALLTSLYDTTTENLNRGFKVAVESLETIADSSERILKKIDTILKILLMILSPSC